MEEELTRLLKLINDTAPMVYEAARGQIQVAIYQDILATLFCLAYIGGYAWFLKNSIAVRDWDDNISRIFMAVFGTVGFLVALVIVLTGVSDLIQLILNPDWYVIKTILGVVK